MSERARFGSSTAELISLVGYSSWRWWDEGVASATLCVDELLGSRIFSFAKKVIAVVSLIRKFGAVSQETTPNPWKQQCLFSAGDQTCSERLRQYVFILNYLKGFLSIHSVFLFVFLLSCLP